MSYNLNVKNMTSEDWLLANCKERSLYILGNYDKTEKQLRDKLKQGKKYNDEIIDKTIVFLKKYNYIDDVAWTKRFIESHKQNYSIKVIKQKLYLKGINKKIIEQVLDMDEIEFDEEKVIKKLLLKRCVDYYDRKDNMDVKEKQKIFAYLLRKGFTYDNVRSVMKV